MHLLLNALSETESRSRVRMADPRGSPVLVVGVGNEFRGDDAVGLYVVRKLREKLAHEAVLVEATGEGASLMECWKGFDAAIIVDAVQSAGQPGRKHRFEAHESALPAKFFQTSTHSFGVLQAIEVARALNQLPRWLTVCGIEGKCFDEGAWLSAPVELAAQQLVESLTIEILNSKS